MNLSDEAYDYDYINYDLLSNKSDQTIESQKESLINSSKEITPPPELSIIFYVGNMCDFI